MNQQKILGAVGLFAGIFLGAVFLIAAWAKTLDPAAFAKQIELEGLDFLLPASIVALIALALEVFLGSSLVLGIRRRWILWPTGLLVAFFLFLTGRTYWRDLQGEPPPETGCGCFGNLVERTPAEAFWQDLLLMVPALLLAFVAAGASRAAPRLRLVVVGALTVATVIFAWKAPELPLDNLATRLKPGAEVAGFCVGSEAEGTRECLDSQRVLPEISGGEHLVVMADLEDSTFGDQVSLLNDYHWAGKGPSLWVVTDDSEEQIFAFRFARGPAFEMREVPAALLRPLYRTLPRSFLVRDGVVTETFPGLPPLDRWSRGAASS